MVCPGHQRLHGCARVLIPGARCYSCVERYRVEYSARLINRQLGPHEYRRKQASHWHEFRSRNAPQYGVQSRVILVTRRLSRRQGYAQFAPCRAICHAKLTNCSRNAWHQTSDGRKSDLNSGARVWTTRKRPIFFTNLCYLITHGFRSLVKKIAKIIVTVITRSHGYVTSVVTSRMCA